MTRPTDADSEPVAWARRDYKERLERTGMTDICEHPDIEGSTEWMVPLYAAPVSETPAIPEAKKLVEWFGRHYGIEGTYPGRGLVEELRLALLAAAPSPNKEPQP